MRIVQIDIRFIAAKAGVSPATVSRVLNNTKPVSTMLQKRVMEQVDRYGYRPNLIARGLIINKSDLIGVVTPSVSGPFHAKLISGIESIADQNGYNVIVSNVSTEFEKEKACFEVLRERRVDGILLLHEGTAEQMEILQQIAKLPIVLGSANVEGCGLCSAGIDDERAAYDITAYLTRMGHRKIGGIFNNCYSLGVLRKAGFCNALRDSNLHPVDQWMRSGECTISEGESLAGEIFSGRETPTALFCVSDELAVGAVSFLMEHGYRVPRDVSVVGFDDIELANVFRPKLTTVHQPIEEIGRAAAEILIRLIETKEKPESVILPYRVVIRASSGPAYEGSASLQWSG